MNIGFDIDGVISDFVKTFIELVEIKYGIKLNEEDIYCHDLNLVLGITKNERNQLITETLKKDLALNRGAKETLAKLFSEGHKIYLLTARYGALLEGTKTWLEKNGVTYSQLLHLCEGQKYLADIDIDVIVEDCLLDALEWTQKTKYVLLFDHPWNQTKNVKKLVKRVRDWDEIYREIKQIAMEQLDS